MGVNNKALHPSAPYSSSLWLVLLTTAAALLTLSPAATSAADLYDLVFKGCANQSFPFGGLASQQALASLSSALIAQSATAKFYMTTASVAGGQPSIFGLFQCRGDLSASDCADCVGRIPAMWSRLCGQAVAARVQLNGCSALYEISGFPQVPGTKMLYKVCGSDGGGGGFEEKRDTAFASLQSAMTSGNAGGFYATSYGNVNVMAQCEGDLSVADCAECVAEAVQKAEVECGGAAYGQMYLDKCYTSYSYYGKGPPGSGGGGGSSGQPTRKTVAIVVGGAAALGFLVVCLFFVRSLYKKRGDY